MAGRFGPYVTDGTTNATITKGIDPAQITLEIATDLIAARVAIVGVGKKKPTRKTATSAKKVPAKKATAAKASASKATAAKKPDVRKPAAKKPAPKKAAA